MYHGFKQHCSFLAVAIAGLLSAALTACGSDASSHAVQAPQVSDEALTGQSCNLEGTWAIKFVVPVSWGMNAGVRAGTGEIVQYAKSVRKVHGLEVTDTLQICSNVLPDYKGLTGERYAIEFPEATFDKGVLDPITVTTHLSGTEVGSHYESEPTVIQMGVSMKDPFNDKWPQDRSQLNTVDADHDGHPGITVHAASGQGYKLPPTNAWGGGRAKTFFLAVRNVAHIEGTVEGCDKTTGTAEIWEIAGKDAIDSYVLGCIKEDGSDCNEKDLNLINGFAPKYKASKGHVLMQRIADSASCADVRKLAL